MCYYKILKEVVNIKQTNMGSISVVVLDLTSKPMTTHFHDDEACAVDTQDLHQWPLYQQWPRYHPDHSQSLNALK